MQKLLFVSSCVFFVASGCASRGTTQGLGPAPAGDGAPQGAPADLEDGGQRADRDGGSSGSRFDLTLTVSEKQSTLMFIVVRDADTREIVAISHDEENAVTKTKLAKKKVLERGHRYEVGIKDTWYAGCLDSSANVWYREIPAVDDHVVLDLEVEVDVDEDARGCDVLHEPVPLPPGTYSTKAPVNGVAGNRVTLYVSESGRLYTKELRVFCAASSASCVPTVLSHGACDYEEVVYPGQTTFSLGDASASRTTVKGTATIEAASQTIRYTGRTFTWTGSGSTCCDENFDVTLEKISGAAAPCP